MYIFKYDVVQGRQETLDWCTSSLVKQNYPFCSFELLLENYETSLYQPIKMIW